MDKFNISYLIADLTDISISKLSKEFLVKPYEIEHTLSTNGRYITIKCCEKYDYEDEVAELLIGALKSYIHAMDSDITEKYDTTLDEILDLDTLEVFLHITECSGCIFIELP